MVIKKQAALSQIIQETMAAKVQGQKWERYRHFLSLLIMSPLPHPLSGNILMGPKKFSESGHPTRHERTHTGEIEHEAAVQPEKMQVEQQ